MEILENVWEIITDAKETVTDYFTGDTVTSRKNMITHGGLCLLFGIVAGFLLAPIKKGIYINISDNGNNNGSSHVPQISQEQKKEKDCCKNKKKGCCKKWLLH